MPRPQHIVLGAGLIRAGEVEAKPSMSTLRPAPAEARRPRTATAITIDVATMLRTGVARMGKAPAPPR